MEKVLRGGGQTSKKQRIQRPLHEFLEEQQEPFLLEDYLLDRQYSSKRIHACPNGDLFSEGLPILDCQSRTPNLQIHDSFQRNGGEHSLPEKNHMNKKKRRRVSRGKIRTDSSLDLLGYSEEYHLDELHADVKRLKFTVQESKTTEMMQVESKRGHGMEGESALIAKTKASPTPMQCMKFFSFKKLKKMNRAEKRKESEVERSVKCFLFKSILKKLTPTNVVCISKRLSNSKTKFCCGISEDELCKNVLKKLTPTNVVCVSKKLSNSKAKLCCGINEDELCKNNRVQHQVSDIISRDSFKEVQPSASDHNSNEGEKCVSLEPVQAFPDLVNVDSFSAEGAWHPLQLSERISEELKVERSDKMVQLQSDIRISSSGSVGFSSTRSSGYGYSLFESYFDSDLGSTSVDKLSTENSFRELMRANLSPSEGISHSLIEETCSSGCLSLDNDEYHAKDCQPCVFKGHDKMNDFHEKICSSDEACQQDYIHSLTPTPKSSMIFEISGHEENPKNFSGSARNANLVFGEMKRKSQENEGEKNVPTTYDIREKNKEISCQEKKIQYASGCSVDSKQLSPVSVLEMSSDEEPSAQKQTDACTPIIEHRFLQRFNEGGQHSWKDSSTSEQRAQRKVPHEGGHRSFRDSSQDNTHGSTTHKFSQISSHASSFQCQEQMDWELGETEEYVRKVLSSPDTMSCLMRLNDSEIRDLTCFSPPDHERFLPSQCLKRKEIPMCARKLLFDCVKEILKSPKKQYGSGVLRESWLNQCSVSENLAKVVCSRINSWMETDTNITGMVELTWKNEGEDWTKFQVDAEEIGIEIEAHVFGLLIEELVDDLSHLQP